VPASQDTLAAAVSAWAAVRHPDPSALAAAAGADLPGLPFLRPALLRLLEELPGPGDGLSGTERRALQAVTAGAATPAAAFLAEQDLEAAPFLGDAWFFRALASLGAGPDRLVETQAGDPLPPLPPLGDARAFARLPLRLTGAGERSWTANRTGSRCLAWTAGWAARISPRPRPGAGTPPPAS
jgi:hypothetical protein